MEHDKTKQMSENDNNNLDTIPAEPEDAVIGTLIDDRYLIQESIGEGGMGHVYKARHILMEKDVAIKLIHSELAHVDDIAKRFEREAKSSSRLAHPNCISVTDFGKTKRNQLFLVMELLEGEELNARLEKKGKISPPEAIEIISQVLKGLGHAHEQGVVHRDLKPENIFLIPQEDGSELVKILDFGIAKMTSENETENLTRTGVVFGTPKYLSPEQALGDKIDHRTDLYALGIILFEILTGTPPYCAETAMDTMSLHLTAPPPRLSDYGIFPRGFQKVITKAMAKKPKERFANAKEFLENIQKIDVNEMTTGLNIADLLSSKPQIKTYVDKIKNTHQHTKIIVASTIALLILALVFGVKAIISSTNQLANNTGNEVNIEEEQTIEIDEFELLLEQAMVHLEEKEAEEAVGIARKAISLKEENSEAILILGHALFISDKQSEALQQYEKAIELDDTQAQNETLLNNLKESLQWETLRRSAALMLAQYGRDEEIEKLVDLCNSPLTSGDVRRAAREALEKTKHSNKIDWFPTLTADFHELKSCKDRNQIINQMAQTGDARFIPFLEDLKPKIKTRARGPQKNINACLRINVESALKKLKEETSGKTK